ncbi:MAG: hypothetical protein WD898_04085 [Candidatus Paceibacterota bacterium]
MSKRSSFRPRPPGEICDDTNCITLPNQAIFEFQKLFKDHYGFEISFEDARIRANNLVNMVDAVYGKELRGESATSDSPHQKGRQTQLTNPEDGF